MSETIIEITPEMTKAGVWAAGDPCLKFETSEEYVERIFIAMLEARRKPSTPDEQV